MFIYEDPVIEIVYFEADDTITDSGDYMGIDFHDLI